VVGRRIGNYQIVQSLAGGGMGTVYLAVHPGIGKRVAIKVLHPQLCSDAELVSRFFQEARAVNEIRHPNIVDITDFGETDDKLTYLVMEFLEGRTLRDAIDSEKALAPDKVATFARQIASALGAAHRVGIVHRDLKPGNIHLVADPESGGERAKLLDFGVAKLLGPQHNSAHHTQAGAVLGTPYYMAPEQVLARPVDARTDVYSLGVVMYEMLTGQRPFQGEVVVEIMNKVVRETPPPPSFVRPGIPPWFDQLVMQCMEKAPEARPQDMAAVVQALQAGAPRATALAATMAAVRPLPTAGAPGPTTAARPAEATMARRSGVARLPAAAESAALPRRSPLAGLSRSQRMAVIGGGSGLVGAVVVGIVIATIGRPKAPPVPPPPPVATLTINSTPPGAQVVRLEDGALLGNAPVKEAQPADNRRLHYKLHLEGYVDARVPFPFDAAGNHTLMVPLIPEPPKTTLAPAPSRPAPVKHHAHAPTPTAQHAAAAAPAAAPAPAPAPASAPKPAAPASRDPTYDTLPPLIPYQNRVRSLGKH
jgi:serine/threonine-protein kinase